MLEEPNRGIWGFSRKIIEIWRLENQKNTYFNPFSKNKAKANCNCLNLAREKIVDFCWLTTKAHCVLKMFIRSLDRRQED
jgi:hypothetical protein